MTALQPIYQIRLRIEDGILVSLMMRVAGAHSSPRDLVDLAKEERKRFQIFTWLCINQKCHFVLSFNHNSPHLFILKSNCSFFHFGNV